MIDLASGNVAAEFDDAETALATLRRASAEHGREAIGSYSLLIFNGERQMVIAMRDDLVRMTLEDSALPNSRPAAVTLG